MCYSSQLYVKAILYKYYSNQLWRSQMHCGKEREAFYQKPVPASWTMIQFLQNFSRELNLLSIHGMGKWNFTTHPQSTHSNFSITLISLFVFQMFVSMILWDICFYACFKTAILLCFKEGFYCCFYFSFEKRFYVLLLM